MSLSNKFNATNIVFDAPEEPEHENSFGVWTVEVNDEVEQSPYQQPIAETKAKAAPARATIQPVDAANLSVFENNKERQLHTVESKTVPVNPPQDAKPGQDNEKATTLSVNQNGQLVEERNAFNAGQKDGAAQVGLMERTNATIREVEIKQNKDKDSEAFQRQLMLRRLMQDMQNTLARINIAIDATKEITKLLEQGLFDVNNENHLELLKDAGINPELAKYGQLTVEYARQHEDELRLQGRDYQKFIDQGKALDSKDPNFDEKIKQLSDDFEMGRLKAQEFVSKETEENRTHALSKIGFNEQEQDLVSNAITDDFEDDFSDDFNRESKVPISAATDIQGEVIKNAPDLQGDFTAATKPQTSITEPAPDNTPTPTVTTIKFDLS